MTQKYDKVVWQDETTSQQGTLINAERLDQMQTAHHYADGFEEVDEVPTEDPGVDYHKVVYCTADTTFYRWNGEEWTKDVDDDTKALLLAHEADHANPHVVTKAQVGLGNCDNTSDLDKPVSTATQTALDDKVTIIPVTSGVKFYSQSSGGTSLYQGTSSPVTGITSVPMRDSSGRIKTAAPSANDDAANKKYVDDADALKLNISDLLSAWQDTPDDDHIPSEKLVKDTIDGVAADLATHEADTVNPHSVTKAQVGLGNVDNKGTVSSWQGTPDNDHIPTEKLVKDSLDLKINTSTLVSAWQTTPDDSHIPSEKLVKDSLGDGSVTKVGTATVGGNLKPIYLNAGAPTTVANDLVDVASAQTIAGVKTLTNEYGIRRITTYARGSGGTATWKLAEVDKDGNNLAMVDIRDDGTYRGIHLRAFGDNGNSYTALQTRTDMADGKTWVMASTRAYNASNTSDVVTIGSLQASTDVVHTAGNETKSGDLTLSSTLILSRNSNTQMINERRNDIDITTNNTTKYQSILELVDSNGARLLTLEVIIRDNKTTGLRGIVRNSDGTDKYVTIASGDVI